MKRSYIVLLLILFANPIFSQWESIGPYGGYIQCMAKDSSGRILVGTPFGGIFRTSDFGENWNQIFMDHLSEDIRSLAINSSGHIFAGTDPHGIFRSTDDGVTWERLFNLVYDRTVISILINSDGTIFAGTFSGLYRSTDNGSTFIQKDNGITSSAIYSLAVFNNYILAGTAYAGIFRSSDDGDNWEEANNGINFNNRIISKLVSSESGDVATAMIYAGVGDMVYTTNDFNWINRSFTGPSVNDILPRSNNDVVVTSQGKIYNFNGTTWSSYVNPPTINYRNIVDDSSGKMIAGTEGLGTIITQDNWTTYDIKVNRMNAVAVAGMKSSGGVINVISKHGPVFESTNFGLSWKNTSYNLQYGFNYDIGKNPVTRTTFAANQFGTYRLPENSTTWQSIGISATKIEFNLTGDVFLFNGLFCYRSQNDGITFPQVSNIGTNISDVTFDEFDNMYAATANQFGIGIGVKYSSDYGQSWSLINTGLTSLNITAVKYIDNNGLGNSCFKNIVAASSDNKFFIKNNDNTWGDYSEGLPTNFYTNNIASVNYGTGIINTLTSKNQLAMNTDVNCDFLLMQPPPGIEITKAFYINIGGKYNNVTGEPTGFYGTTGTSVLRHNLLATDVSDRDKSTPTAFLLDQNYPNPFNPITNIRYDIPNSNFVSIKVFDVLGKEVATLVNEFKPAGSYKINFIEKNLPSGAYFYRLQAGNYIQTNKMILIK